MPSTRKKRDYCSKLYKRFENELDGSYVGMAAKFMNRNGIFKKSASRACRMIYNNPKCKGIKTKRGAIVNGFNKNMPKSEIAKLKREGATSFCADYRRTKKGDQSINVNYKSGLKSPTSKTRSVSQSGKINFYVHKKPKETSWNFLGMKGNT